ncbi:MAG TPA: hypothetical protein PKK06_13680 [Phycisphaerae bacterium]|nr:hypothetical protein [Phycisphaerae bacterium]HNU46136.1 hypothetical protein [Phycisphaerae bacterium]
MRVALVQLRFEAKGRAANTQRLLQAIDEAAQAEPPPDLLVLPGGCDSGGLLGERGYPAAQGQEFREVIAWQARQWGVYLAAGLHRTRGEGPVPVTLLFDPDGDVLSWAAPQMEPTPVPTPVGVLVAAHAEMGGSAKPWTEAAEATVIVSAPPTSPSGEKAEVEPQAGPPGVNSPCPEGAGPLSWGGALAMLPIAVTIGGRKTRGDERFVADLLEQPVARRGAFWAVVCPGGGGAQPWEGGLSATFLCGPDGAVLARADSREQIVVFAEVPLAVPARSARF